MQDNGASVWMAVDPGASLGADLWATDAFDAWDGGSVPFRTIAARSVAESGECECPFDCLRDHENE